MDDNTNTRRMDTGGYNTTNPSAQGGNTFDLGDPAQRQQALQWLQQFQQQDQEQGDGNTRRLPHEDLGQLYHGWASQAEPQHVEEAATQAAQQMAPQQRAGFAESIMGWLQQQGINPQQLGIRTTNPQQMSPQDVGRMVGAAGQQDPDILKQLLGPGGALSNPAVQLGIAGALAFALSRMGRR
jgi:hypothetical protein